MTTLDYSLLFEQPHHLTLERESARMWIVVDAANPSPYEDLPLTRGVPHGTVMIRTPDRDLAVRFMDAFVAKTPGAFFDRATVEHSWRVAQDATSHDRLANVYRIKPHEQIDEAS